MVSLAFLLAQWLDDIRIYFTAFFTNSGSGHPAGPLAHVADETSMLSVINRSHSYDLSSSARANRTEVVRRPISGVSLGADRSDSQTNFCAASDSPIPNPQGLSSDGMQTFASPSCVSESIELSTYHRGVKHHFCPIPLDADIFCDSCNCPIYNLGSGPVCQRCADCHITCHEWCTKSVQVPCNGLVSVNHPPFRNSANKVGRFLNGHEEFVQSTAASPLAALSVPSSCTMTADSPILAGAIPASLGALDQTEYPAKQETHAILAKTCGNELVATEKSPREIKTLERGFHPTAIGRSNTQLDQVHKPRKTNLSIRHSFLAGHGLDATAYSKLSYDFSSLDRKTINDHGIRVRELNLNSANQTPPCPPQRISSLNQSTPSEQPSLSSLDTSSEYGFACVMQTTADFIKKKPRRNKYVASTPAPTPPLALVVVGPRGRLPYTAEQLLERLMVFNSNEFGLQSRPASHLPPNDCEGTVRIHINLLRPIHMLLTVRPVSIFDLVGKKDDGDGGGGDVIEEFSWDVDPSPTNAKCSDRTGLQINGAHFYPPKSAVTANVPPFSADCGVPYEGIKRRLSKRLFGAHPQSATFWLPRGSTKLLYVRLSTTAQKVIALLLDRFQIEDNPQKFALYEHTIEGDQQVSVRKLFDDESPLGLFLRWTEEGKTKFNQLLSVKRLVLQENETGDIEWNGFSLPELNTFLRILNQEEAEYRRKIELKYELRRKEVLRLIALHERQVPLPALSVAAAGSEISEGSNLPTIYSRGEDCSATESKEAVCDLPQSSITPSSSPVSTSIPPVLRCLSEEHPVSPDPHVINDSPSYSPEIIAAGLTVVSAQTSPSHSPARVMNKTARTLPRLPAPDELGKTLFRPSAYKQMKKADKAEQKRLEKAEKERLKAEKKRLKTEAKLAKQNQPDGAPIPSRRLFNFVVLPRTSSPFPSADLRSTLKR